MASHFGTFLRYTSVSDNRVAVQGWLVKEGRKFKKQTARYLKLQGTQLSNHRSPSQPATWTISVVDSSVGPGPRANELLVRRPGRIMSFFAGNSEEFEKWIIALKRASASNISIDTFYKMGEIIGEGVNGNVLKGWDRATNEEVAIKSIPYEGNMADEADADAEIEIEIIKSLDHPHLVRTYDVFRSKSEQKVYIVMEFVSGGELFARIVNDTGNLIKEGDGIRVARNILSAIKYLHERDIVHRDIKAENVLCIDEDCQKPVRVKLADFGLSKKLSATDECLSSMVGTGYYLAPEIIEQKGYGKSVDMWACGVLLYITISGQLPFEGVELKEYYDNVLNQKIEFPPEHWAQFSENVKDFVRKLLEKDPSKRPTVEQALDHSWVTDKSIADAAFSPHEISAEVDMDEPKSIFHRRKKRPEEILAKVKMEYQ